MDAAAYDAWYRTARGAWIGDLEYARAHGGANEVYLTGDARDLPFADASVDLVVSVTALCFIEDQRRALREIARVARNGVALGLLNRGFPAFGPQARKDRRTSGAEPAAVGRIHRACGLRVMPLERYIYRSLGPA